MRRREFIAGLGSAAAWPVVAGAQQPAMPVIGWLFEGAREGLTASPVRKGLSEMGFVEGGILRSSTALRTITQTDCRRWRTILCAETWR
jgi:hypothetical protein